ncbi:alpha/beta hydrolase, partial [Marinobacter halodurans]
MIPKYQEEGLPFRPSYAPLDDHGDTPPCCMPDASIELRREDNTGQVLAPSRSGPVQNLDTGDSATPEVDKEAGVVRYEHLTPGEYEWHWRPDPLGTHLIGLDTVSDTYRFQPGQALTDTPLIEATPEGRQATAVHLPPPVLINLRDEPDKHDILTPEQLDYFKRNGNNALVFIHGYNVPHGDWGRFCSQAEGDSAPLAWTDTPSTVWQDAGALSRQTGQEVEEARLNGSGVHNWAVSMEYQLNRAAGFDGENWMDYSRIIAISWHGDTGATDFMQSEFNAMQAGRRLVPLLRQLRQAGIAINVITHSLGARVGLTALNILGTVQQTPAIDNLFLWEPAVADNALTNDPERDAHPLGMGVFDKAHKAARTIVVLHSRGDGILGKAGFEDLTRGDGVDNATGSVGGAYTKKWWTFPFFLDNGLTPPIERLYADYFPLVHYPRPKRGQIDELRDRLNRQKVESNWQRLEADILTEAERLFPECKAALANCEALPTYTLLAPLGHQAVVTKSMAQRYIRQLRALSELDWFPGQAPRPA